MKKLFFRKNFLPPSISLQEICSFIFFLDGSIKGANRLKSLPGFLSKVVDSAREVYDSTPESIQEKRVLLKSSSKPVPQTYKDSRTLGETINSSSKIIETSNEILRVSDQLDLNNDSEFDQIFFVNDPMFR